jgi:hypothetical protein
MGSTRRQAKASRLHVAIYRERKHTTTDGAQLPQKGWIIGTSAAAFERILLDMNQTSFVRQDSGGTWVPDALNVQGWGRYANVSCDIADYYRETIRPL